MKKPLKIYLEEDDIRKLKEKAGNGRGAINQYITKIAREPVCFLDANVRVLIKTLNLK